MVRRFCTSKQKATIYTQQRLTSCYSGAGVYCVWNKPSLEIKLRLISVLNGIKVFNNNIFTKVTATLNTT